MPLTKDFRDTVKARADRDPEFRAGLFEAAVQLMLDGDMATARLMLRDFINATVGFTALAETMGVHDKALMRMFSPAGNPTADNLILAIVALRAGSGVTLHVQAEVEAASQKPEKHTWYLGRGVKAAPTVGRKAPSVAAGKVLSSSGKAMASGPKAGSKITTKSPVRSVRKVVGAG